MASKVWRGYLKLLEKIDFCNALLFEMRSLFPFFQKLSNFLYFVN